MQDTRNVTVDNGDRGIGQGTIPTGRSSRGNTSPFEGRIVNVDPDKPWSEWPLFIQSPTKVEKYPATAVRTVSSETGAELHELLLGDGDGRYYVPSMQAITDLAKHAKFPADFVNKLPTGIQSLIINNCFDRLPEDKRDLNLVVGRNISGDLTTIGTMPIDRECASQSWIAQTAWDIFSRMVGESSRIAIANAFGNTMTLRLRSDLGMPISPNGRAVGDVLGLGVQVHYRYGISIEVSLYVERLVCLNGMTAISNAFDWKSSLTGSIGEQLMWIESGVSQAITQYPNIVQRAQLMYNTPIEGNIDRAVVERARAIGLRGGQIDDVLQAFREEPGNNEWSMLNAITRYATHNENVSEVLRRRLHNAAGKWVHAFDMVNARLPRPIAEAVGASIFGDDDAE